MNTTLLRKINRRPPAASRNAVSPSGSYTHWVWRDTGIRRPHRHTPKLLIGFEMDAVPEGMPPDGGSVAAGKWATTKPTGHRRLLWD